MGVMSDFSGTDHLCSSCTSIHNPIEFAGEIFGTTPQKNLFNKSDLQGFYLNPYATFYNPNLGVDDPYPTTDNTPDDAKELFYISKTPGLKIPSPIASIRRAPYQAVEDFNPDWRVELPNSPTVNFILQQEPDNFGNYIIPGVDPPTITTPSELILSSVRGIVGGSVEQRSKTTHIINIIAASYANGKQNKINVLCRLFGGLFLDTYDEFMTEGSGELLHYWLQIDPVTQEIEVLSQGLAFSSHWYVADAKWTSDPVVPEFFGRNNISIGNNSIVKTEYDDAPNTNDGIMVDRIYRLEGEPSFDIKRFWVQPSYDTSEYWVVRGPRDVHDDEAGPWVIARRPSDNKWVTGRWTNEEVLDEAAFNLPPEFADKRRRGVLLEEEVENVIDDGTILNSPYFRCLCYNRVYTNDGMRELAIFYRSGVFERGVGEDEDCDFSPGTIQPTDGYIQYAVECYIYDSARTEEEGKLFKYSEDNSACYEPEPGTQDQTGCTTAVADLEDHPLAEDLFGDQELDGYWNPPSFVGSANIPTYITADLNGDVYLGSPKFVAKQETKARPEIFGFDWRVIASDYYPIIGVSAAGCIDPPDNSTLYRFLPFAASAGSLVNDWNGIERQTNSSSAPYYGNMDYRDFSITPMSSGRLHVNGFEGFIEMASWEGEELEVDNVITPTDQRYLKLWPHDRNFDTSTRNSWFPSWVFSTDGLTRVPHAEPYSLAPDIGYKRDAPTYRHINATVHNDINFEAAHFANLGSIENGDITLTPDNQLFFDALTADPTYINPLTRRNYLNNIFRVGPRHPYERNIISGSVIGQSGFWSASGKVYFDTNWTNKAAAIVDTGSFNGGLELGDEDAISRDLNHSTSQGATGKGPIASLTSSNYMLVNRLISGFGLPVPSIVQDIASKVVYTAIADDPLPTIEEINAELNGE